MTDPAKMSLKSKRDIIITSILLVIFAVTFTKNVLFRHKPAPVPSPAQAPLVVNTTDATQGMSDQLVVVTNIRLYDKLAKEREALWEREWARDPFAAQQTVAGLMKAVNLTLNGVLWDEKTPKAIVNEKTLLTGDTIYGYTVMEIKPRSVMLKTGEKTIELRIFGPVLAETGPSS
jgi:hypothetical protein